MKLFQKRSVAAIVMVAAIVVGILLGQARKPDTSVEATTNLSGSYQYTFDTEDVISEKTMEYIDAMNASLFAQTGAQIVVASLGHEGLLAVTADEVVRARLPRVLKGNATGAGDAAVAAIALALAEGARSGSSVPDLSGLARRATAWSASAVLMPLAGDLHPDHVALADEVLIDDPESE